MAKLWWSVIGLVVVASLVAWAAVGGLSWTECDCPVGPPKAENSPKDDTEKDFETVWYGNEESELVEVIDLSDVYEPVPRLEPIAEFPNVIPEHPRTGRGAIMPYIGDTDEPPTSEPTCWIGHVIGGLGLVQKWCKGDCPFSAPIGCGTGPKPPATMDTLEVREGDLPPKKDKPF